ncbi:FHA domain-containing protein, partial [Streptomyces sp. NPDC051776]|uniref:FHA domain-containing protein n=1 Tax=Streptomyces sp. NPDC051776 TaxID=3155414 RepID=UPI00341A5308
MQIRLTVLGPRGGHTARACDVLVTAPAGTALAAVASGLAAAAAAASGAAVSAGSAAAGPTSGKGGASGPPAGDPASGGSGGSSGPVVLYAGSERLDPQRCALGEPPLTDGAVLSLNSPADPGRHPGVPQEAPTDASAQLHVVAGPDAGGVHLLHSGRIRIGRSAEADVPLDDPDVSRLHCAVTVTEDGQVTIADLGSTNGTSLDGAPLGTGPLPFHPGSLLRLGESALRLVGAGEALPIGRETLPGAGGALPGGALPGEALPGEALPGEALTGAGGAGAALPAGARSGGSGSPMQEVLPTAPDGEGHLRVSLRGRAALDGAAGSAHRGDSTVTANPLGSVGFPAPADPAGSAAAGLGAIAPGETSHPASAPDRTGPAASGRGTGAPSGPAAAPRTAHGGSDAPRRPSWATGPCDDEDGSAAPRARAGRSFDEHGGEPAAGGSVPPPRTTGASDTTHEDSSGLCLPHQAPDSDGPFPRAGQGAVTHGAGHRTRRPDPSPSPSAYEGREAGGAPGG